VDDAADPARAHVHLVHEDDPAYTEHAAIAVIERIDPGVVLVIAANRRQPQYHRVVSAPASRCGVIPLKTELVRLLDWDFVVGRI
jgi:hypothetical protein